MSERPLVCWWCGRPALDAGSSYETLNGLLIMQRIAQARRAS